MIAVQFEDVGANGTINLQNVIKGNFVGTTSPGTAPTIQVWDTSAGSTGAYKTYCFWSMTLGQPMHNNVWSKSISSTDYDPDITVKIGDSIWFKCQQSDCTIQVAGQVVEVDPSGERGVDVVADKWNMIANPFPKNFVVNNGGIDWTKYFTGTTSTGTAPTIQIWDLTAGTDGAYKSYYFFSDTLGGTKQYNVWSSARQTTYYDPNLAVPAGAGFWLKYPKAQGKSEKEDGSLTLKFEF